MLSTVTKDHASGDAYLNLACPVCGCLPVPHLKHDRYFADRRPGCGFVYVRNIPTKERTAAFDASSDAQRPTTPNFPMVCS